MLLNTLSTIHSPLAMADGRSRHSRSRSPRRAMVRVTTSALKMWQHEPLQPGTRFLNAYVQSPMFAAMVNSANKKQEQPTLQDGPRNMVQKRCQGCVSEGSINLAREGDDIIILNTTNLAQPFVLRLRPLSGWNKPGLIRAYVVKAESVKSVRDRIANCLGVRTSALSLVYEGENIVNIANEESCIANVVAPWPRDPTRPIDMALIIESDALRWSAASWVSYENARYATAVHAGLLLFSSDAGSKVYQCQQLFDKIVSFATRVAPPQPACT